MRRHRDGRVDCHIAGAEMRGFSVSPLISRRSTNTEGSVHDDLANIASRHNSVITRIMVGGGFHIMIPFQIANISYRSSCTR